MDIYFPVIYRGPQANPENIKIFQDGITSKWTGDIGGVYDVRVFFMDGGYKTAAGVLVGNIVYMAAGGNNTASYFSPANGLLAFNVDRPIAAGHEFGHAMRNSLHYDRPHDGYENNIMVRNSGIVEPINIREAFEAWGGSNSATFRALAP